MVNGRKFGTYRRKLTNNISFPDTPTEKMSKAKQNCLFIFHVIAVGVRNMN